MDIIKYVVLSKKSLCQIDELPNKAELSDSKYIEIVTNQLSSQKDNMYYIIINCVRSQNFAKIEFIMIQNEVIIQLVNNNFTKCRFIISNSEDTHNIQVHNKIPLDKDIYFNEGKFYQIPILSFTKE